MFCCFVVVFLFCFVLFCFVLFCFVFVLFGVFVCVKLPEVELLDKVCKAVCSIFARVGGGGGGANLEYLKKKRGAGRSCKQCQEEELEDNIKKKNSLVIVRGYEIDTSRGGVGRGNEYPHPPINTSLLVRNGPEGFGWLERMS